MLVGTASHVVSETASGTEAAGNSLKLAPVSTPRWLHTNYIYE